MWRVNINFDGKTKIDPKSIKINKGINFPEEVWILETPEIAQEWLNEINNLVDFLRSN